MFEYLNPEFKLKFEWYNDIYKVAEQVNSFHEDYPKYVEKTLKAIDILRIYISELPKRPQNLLLFQIHSFVFFDKVFRGKFRDVNVSVGNHYPPKNFLVYDMMEQLEKGEEIKTIEEIISWYIDMESIHPFQDGNGRIGGILVAIYSHKLFPEKGWFTVCQ